jgi:hypothetical protein
MATGAYGWYSIKRRGVHLAWVFAQDINMQLAVREVELPPPWGQKGCPGRAGCENRIEWGLKAYPAPRSGWQWYKITRGRGPHAVEDWLFTSQMGAYWFLRYVRRSGFFLGRPNSIWDVAGKKVAP